ncbi:MAG TPA: 30S ribosomal protein S6 [Anaerolineaceae bacterium]|jgi:small subunit ribosomal protein S6|nr:30S ribosomal protein S6 [Anaerolineaceae bacterium]HOA20963.1 30S ribosomal protein S6 [Anaerolineaceae bacterium]HOG76734.1 30S ribosomal protein S6 [Anaerolineaceae bacterium]
MHTYELVYILQADLDEATLNGLVETVENLIKSTNGEILKVDRWGKRRLAYPIRKLTEGYYVFVTFKLDPVEVANIRRTLGYNEQILRSIVVRAA